MKVKSIHFYIGKMVRVSKPLFPTKASFLWALDVTDGWRLAKGRKQAARKASSNV